MSSSHQIKKEEIEIIGARTHNLKNVNLKIPRKSLTVITGVSGSGKSSLAFDTIYAEGKRRYMNNFSMYARMLFNKMERADVDKVTGLSPVISIEQKTTSNNPKSTIGTVTEIYDFIRLLFAKISIPYSYKTGKKMVQQSEEEIQIYILKKFINQTINILVPLVQNKKGNQKSLLRQLLNQNLLEIRINGQSKRIEEGMELDSHKRHTIEVVLDTLKIEEGIEEKLKATLGKAFSMNKKVIMVQDQKQEIHFLSKEFVDTETGLSYPEPTPNSFSFNSIHGMCENCSGIGEIVTQIQRAQIINENLSTLKGGIKAIYSKDQVKVIQQVKSFFKKNNIEISEKVKELSKDVINNLLYIPVKTYLNENPSWNLEDIYNEFRKEHLVKETCPECAGSRLKKLMLQFKIASKSIKDLVQMSIPQLYDFFTELPKQLAPKEVIISAELIREISKRIKLLIDIGLDYVQLNRSFPTLSGGESQRIRLARQIGSHLVGILYILDEPSIGLHQRDNLQLIKALKSLKDLGNTIIVVEHDKDIMLHADYIIDIGPEGGRKNGGNLVAAGDLKNFLKQKSITRDFIKNVKTIELLDKKRISEQKLLQLKGCKGNNLKGININIPLGNLICVTGVSGSGKSTLIHHTLYPILQNHFYKSGLKVMPYKSLEGIGNIDKVVEIDQSPIGKMSRSCPATYINIFTDIRKIYQSLPKSKTKGYSIGRFSFNVVQGRCSTCRGIGTKMIDMKFLPNVRVTCDECGGKRYNPETLSVAYKGKSIGNVLEMTVDEAVEFFEKYPKILKYMQTMQKVGLGYIHLGQSSNTLSGGEAQRIKLAEELSKRDTGKTFYILDEPTTGLHFQDIQKLMNTLNELVNRGNTVLIIEHNIDVIKNADYIIDLGPEGGEKGGEIVFQGYLTEFIKQNKGYTAPFLQEDYEVNLP